MEYTSDITVINDKSIHKKKMKKKTIIKHFIKSEIFRLKCKF